MISLQQFTFNPYQENTYLLYNEQKECIIIDPGMYEGWEQNQVVRFVHEQGLSPVLLLNTHCHIDHVLGNKFVYDQWGLKPQFHKGELVLLQSVASYAPQMGFHYELSPEPDTFIEAGSQISFGDSKLQAIWAPGHSPAHLCFFDEEENFLIGGDVLFRESIGRTDLPGGNHQQLLESIKSNLYSLPNNCVVYPGHGPSTTIAHEKSHNPFVRA